MDAPTSAAIIMGLQVVGKPAVETSHNLLVRLLGPFADASGKALASPIDEWTRRRAERANKVVLTAGEILASTGTEPTAVPGRLLMPIVEKSSVEENEDVSVIWSRMLAAAADPEMSARIWPAFPHILGELSPLEVKILDFVARHAHEGSGKYVLRHQAIRPMFGIHDGAVMGAINDNLIRLRLVSLPVAPLATNDDLDYTGPLYLTTLGAMFIDACTYPEKTP